MVESPSNGISGHPICEGVIIPRCDTPDGSEGGRRASTDTRAASFFSDQTFRRRRWDSASHLQQAIFRVCSRRLAWRRNSFVHCAWNHARFCQPAGAVVLSQLCMQGQASHRLAGSELPLSRFKGLSCFLKDSSPRNLKRPSAGRASIRCSNILS